MLKRVEESEQPCFTPLLMSKLLVSSSSILMDAVCSQYKFLISHIGPLPVHKADSSALYAVLDQRFFHNLWNMGEHFWRNTLRLNSDIQDKFLHFLFRFNSVYLSVYLISYDILFVITKRFPNFPSFIHCRTGPVYVPSHSVHFNSSFLFFALKPPIMLTSIILIILFLLGSWFSIVLFFCRYPFLEKTT